MLFGRRRAIQETSIAGLPASHRPAETAKSLSKRDLQWEQSVQAVAAMTSAQLFRDAAEEIVNGDQAKRTDSATMYYSRGAAVANLATYKALEESGQIPPAPVTPLEQG